MARVVQGIKSLFLLEFVRCLLAVDEIFLQTESHSELSL